MYEVHSSTSQQAASAFESVTSRPAGVRGVPGRQNQGCLPTQVVKQSENRPTGRFLYYWMANLHYISSVGSFGHSLMKTQK